MYLILLGLLSLIALVSMGAIVILAIVTEKKGEARWVYALAGLNLAIAIILWILSRKLDRQNDRVAQYQVLDQQHVRVETLEESYSQVALQVAGLSMIMFFIAFLFEIRFDNPVVGYFSVAFLIAGSMLALLNIGFIIRAMRVYLIGVTIPPILMARLRNIRRGGNGNRDDGQGVEMGPIPRNVHNEYDRLVINRQAAIRFMHTYLRNPEKKSQKWRQELEYPFDPSELSFSHTPSSMLNSDHQGTLRRALLRGLQDILERRAPGSRELTELRTKVTPVVCQSRLRLDRGKVALMCLLFIYNETQINGDWARIVVNDAVNALGRDVVSCVDGLAERMAIFFFDIVSSRCVQHQSTMKNPIRRLCEVIDLRTPTRLRPLDEANLDALLSEWGMTEDEDYAQYTPETRRDKLIRFIVERVVPVPGIEGRVAAMIDPKLNFNEVSKADAIIEGEFAGEEK
jgi:hypothetical protein